jgi:hypothetical protein
MIPKYASQSQNNMAEPEQKTLRGMSPRVNYTDQAIGACRQS